LESRNQHFILLYSVQNLAHSCPERQLPTIRLDPLQSNSCTTLASQLTLSFLKHLSETSPIRRPAWEQRLYWQTGWQRASEFPMSPTVDQRLTVTVWVKQTDLHLAHRQPDNAVHPETQCHQEEAFHKVGSSFVSPPFRILHCLFGCSEQVQSLLVNFSVKASGRVKRIVRKKPLHHRRRKR
jgi:hypothetical protein